MKRTVNSKLAFLILAIMVVGAALMFGLHQLQSGRNADLFMSAANQAGDEGDTKRALRSYRSLLKLEPDSMEGRSGLANLLFDYGDYSGASEQFEYALRLDPDAMDLRRKAVQCALRTGRASDAMDHLRRLLETEQDAELLDWLAQCEMVTESPEKAVSTFRQSIQADPSRVDVYVRLASVLTNELGRDKEAQEVLDDLIEKNPESSDAHARRGQVIWLLAQRLFTAGELEEGNQRLSEAETSARRSVALDPENVDSLLLVARCELARENVEEARNNAILAQKASNQDLRPYLLIAELENQNGQRATAIQWLLDGITTVESGANKSSLYLNLAGLYLDDGAVEDALAVIEQMKSTRSEAALIGLLTARVEAAQEKWLESVRRLESIRPSLSNRASLLKQVDYWLGQGHQALSQPELSATAFRRAIEVDPSWVAPRLSLAAVLESSGQLESAFTELRNLMQMDGAPDDGWISLARTSLRLQAMRPPAERDWAMCGKLLDQAEQRLPGRAEIPVLRSQWYAAQGNLDRASSLLDEKATVSFSGDSAQQIALVLAKSDLALNQERWEEAEKTLVSAWDKYGPRASLLMARAALVARGPSDQKESKLRALARDAEQFSPSDRRESLLRLAQLARAMENFELAAQFVLPLMESTADDMGVWQLAFDIAYATKDTAMLDQALGQIRSIQGEGAAWQYGSAIQLRMKSGPAGLSQEDSALIMNHLAKAQELRPGWSQPSVLRADLLIENGDREGGLKELVLAIERGAQSAEVLRRAVVMLYEDGNYREANRVLDQFQGVAQGQGIDLQRMASAVSLRMNDVDGGLVSARHAAAKSDQFRDHLWLAQVATLAAGRVTDGSEGDLLAEAESAHLRSLELADGDPQPWTTWIRFLAGQGRLKEGRAALQDARENIQEESKLLALAEANEYLGELDQAATLYRQAAESSKDLETCLRSATGFHNRQGQHEEAQGYLEQMLKLSELTELGAVWARRNLALMHLVNPGGMSSDRALKLVQENLDAVPKSAADLRTKAMLLASGPKNKLDDAIGAWCDVVALPNDVTAADQFSLARLLRGEPEWAEASRLYRTAVTNERRPEARMQYLQEYVSRLLEMNQLSDAELWLAQLKKEGSESDGFRMLHATMLVRKGQHEEAAGSMNERLRSIQESPASEDAVEQAAQLIQLGEAAELAERGAPEAAKHAYAEVAEKAYRSASVKNIRARFSLAVFLHRHDQVEAAIKQLNSHPVGESEVPLAVRTADVMTVSGRLDDGELDQIAAFIRSIGEQHGPSSSLTLVQASIHQARGELDLARKAYRSILKTEPNHLIALNNLAVSLGESDDMLREAAVLSDRSIELAGRLPALLDSRAVIALAAGNAEQGLELLQEATRRSEGAIFLFHRAVARLRTGQPMLAAQDFRKAVENGLETQQLSKRERDWLAELKQTG